MNTFNTFKIVNNNSEISSAAENSYFYEDLNVFKCSKFSEDSFKIRTSLEEFSENNIYSDIKLINKNNTLNSSH